MLRIGGRRHRMSSAIEFRTEPEKEASRDKNKDPLLFGREKNSAQVLMLTCRRQEEKRFVRRPLFSQRRCHIRPGGWGKLEGGGWDGGTRLV